MGTKALPVIRQQGKQWRNSLKGGKEKGHVRIRLRRREEGSPYEPLSREEGTCIAIGIRRKRTNNRKKGCAVRRDKSPRIGGGGKVGQSKKKESNSTIV